MKILNLYSGLGGNRKNWGNTHNITAVELNADIAKIYGDYFPKDKVIVGDAHEYLQNHFSEYDFIWASPPCQSHSQMRQNLAVRFRGTPAVYPDMKLYQEIIFLRHNFKGVWLVENVRPYYEPLIKPDFILQRHLYWANFQLPQKKFDTDLLRKAQIPDLSAKYGFDLSKYKLKDRRQILRNCVAPEIGEHIFKYVQNAVKSLQQAHVSGSAYCVCTNGDYEKAWEICGNCGKEAHP